MKFNKLYKKYHQLFAENIIPQAQLPIHQGDQVTFVKGWEKKLENLAQSSTGERIREMIAQKDNPLVAYSIVSKKPASYGAHGSPNQNGGQNEEEFTVTVGEQYALGLYKNIVSVPMYALERIDNGINLTPLSKNQSEKPRKQTTGEEPKLDKNLSDPTTQTHASWKDHGINKL